MPIIKKEITTSEHTYLLSFSDDFREKGHGHPHDVRILAIDGREVDEDEGAAIAMHQDPEEFQEVIEGILDATAYNR